MDGLSVQHQKKRTFLLYTFAVLGDGPIDFVKLSPVNSRKRSLKRKKTSILRMNRLTCSPAKNQTFALIRKFNFEISSSSVSKLWCLKCIDINLTPIWTPLWGPSGPKVPNMEKPGTLVLNNFRWKSPVMLWHFTSKIFEDVISLKTEKTENFFQILILEFFNCDNLFPGKILSRIQVSHMFWCLVTPKTPRGSLGSLNIRTSVTPKFHSKFCQKKDYHN